MIYLIFLGIIFVGITLLVILLASEKRSGSEALEQLQEAETVRDRLKDENRILLKRLKSTEESISTLTRRLNAKDEEFVKTSSQVQTRIAQFIDQTKLKDIMAQKVISINVDAPFAEVPKKMKEHSIRHLPVVDDDNRLVGLITQRMMYQIQSPHKLVDGEWFYDEEILNGVILKHVMERDVCALHPEHSLGKALMKMVYSKFGGIPIVDNDKKLIGIITRKDILKVAARIYEDKHPH